jgi:hypothetical protein
LCASRQSCRFGCDFRHEREALRYLLVLILGVALASISSACSSGGDSGESAAAQTAGETAEESLSGATTEENGEARAIWVAAVDDACDERAGRIASVARDLPRTIERGGFQAGGAAMRDTAEDALAAIREAELAPDDAELGADLTAGYENAWLLEARAVAAPYKPRDRRFLALMNQAGEATDEANELADELGVTTCGKEVSGPYASTNGYAAVRWGMRASQLCRARDRAFGRLRSTDIAGFDRVSAQFLARMRTLARPEPYAQRINRFLRDYAASLEASRQGDFETSNRLVEKSSTLLYSLGFDIGYNKFCSTQVG